MFQIAPRPRGRNTFQPHATRTNIRALVVRIKPERGAGITPNDAWQSLGHAAGKALARMGRA
jgi:hypothetical protein